MPDSTPLAVVVPSRVNNVTQPWVWASTAATEIPEPPRTGTAYRSTTTPDSTYNDGQKYDVEGESALWNSMLYKISSATQTFLNYGISPYEPEQSYSQYAFCLGTDGLLYQAKTDIPVVAGEDHAPPAWNQWEQKSFGIPTYSGTQYYAKNSLVMDADGNLYMAKADIAPSTAEESHAPPAWSAWELKSFGIEAYSATQYYDKNAIVMDAAGNLYIAKEAVTPSTPTEDHAPPAWSAWKLLLPDSSGGYQPNVSYPAGTVIVYNNKLYYSIADIPPSTAENPHEPGTDPNWKEAGGELPPIEAGHSWYVGGASGNDANNGLTAQTPLATIDKALELAKNLPQRAVAQKNIIYLLGDTTWDSPSIQLDSIKIENTLTTEITVDMTRGAFQTAVLEFAGGPIVLNQKNTSTPVSFNLAKTKAIFRNITFNGVWYISAGSQSDIGLIGVIFGSSSTITVSASGCTILGNNTLPGIQARLNASVSIQNSGSTVSTTKHIGTVFLYNSAWEEVGTVDFSALTLSPFWLGKKGSVIDLSQITSFTAPATPSTAAAYQVTTSSTIILPIKDVWDTVPANPVGLADAGSTVYQIDPAATPVQDPNPISITAV